MECSIENVAVSTRIRLARNFAAYPFPNMLKQESGSEIVNEVTKSLLSKVEDLSAYYMDTLPATEAEFLRERNLISRALINNRLSSAALIACDESVSIMINEEDHIREQVFLLGYNLRRAYDRAVSIDEAIAEIMPYAYDEEFGYLTACPTNLGTGLRASVMLFLPGLVRRNKLRPLLSELKKRGLTMRGAFGEGSGAEGYLFQISNEVTLGVGEQEILACVENDVELMIAEEIKAREELLETGGIALEDKILRAYGTLTNCLSIGMDEFLRLLTEVKIGVCLGILEGSMKRLDALLVDMRPANIDHLNGAVSSEAEQNIFRADTVNSTLRRMELCPEENWNKLFKRR